MTPIMILIYICLAILLLLCGFTYWCYYYGTEFIAQRIHKQMGTWRLQANKRPKRIFLIRHGESQGNIDKSIYERVPDNKIELTELGLNQAIKAGAELKRIIGDESVLFLVSPFRRSRQTYQMIVNSFDKNSHRMREDPRIREQEWGNYQSLDRMEAILAEREKVGRFFYRFSDGESGADVFDRVSSFMESLFREIDTQQPVQNIVIISHGLFIRLFLMRFFRWTVEKFNAIWNFDNCEYALLEKHPVSGSYELKTELKMNTTLGKKPDTHHHGLHQNHGPQALGPPPAVNAEGATVGASPTTTSEGSTSASSASSSAAASNDQQIATLSTISAFASPMKPTQSTDGTKSSMIASQAKLASPTPHHMKLVHLVSPASKSPSSTNNTVASPSSLLESILLAPESSRDLELDGVTGISGGVVDFIRVIPSPMESVYDSSFAIVGCNDSPRPSVISSSNSSTNTSSGKKTSNTLCPPSSDTVRHHQSVAAAPASASDSCVLDDHDAFDSNSRPSTPPEGNCQASDSSTLRDGQLTQRKNAVSAALDAAID